MKMEIPVFVNVLLRHADSPSMVPNEFATKAIETSLTVEVPQNFLDILNAFDTGTSLITLEVMGQLDLKPDKETTSVRV